MGNWTGIHWTHLKTAAEVWTDSGWNVFGWDGGYVAFGVLAAQADSGSQVARVRTQHSTDGVSWFPGRSFDVPPADQALPYGGLAAGAGVAGVVQGPGGLLAYDYYDCVCACVVPRVVPLAVSTDGANWQAVKGNVVGNWLGAGPAGYIITDGTAVQISHDGVSWTKAQVRGTASVKVDRIDSGTSFGGGFVISSEAYAGMVDGVKCPVRYPIPGNPMVWFSADGKTWTPQVLPDRFSGPGYGIEVCRFNELLLAEEWTDVDKLQWSSVDGKTWTSTSADVGCSEGGAGGLMRFGGVMSFAGHYIYVGPPCDMGSPYWGVRAISPDLRLETMPQTGDLPGWRWFGEGPGALGVEALGPAGLILSDGQGNLWIGVPTEGATR
jgi:hypothetical protein